MITMVEGNRYSPKYKRFYNDHFYYADPTHEYKPSRRNAYAFTGKKTRDPLYFLMRRAQIAHDLAQRCSGINMCDSGFTEGQGWAGLYRAWIGFIIGNNDKDDEKMVHYAKAIRKIEQDMKLQMTQFPTLKQLALEYANEKENADIIEDAAEELDKDPDDLTSEDVLNEMMKQDRLAYELAGMDYY